MVGEPEDIDVQAFAWDHNPGGNVEHLARHGVTPEDVEAVLDFVPLFFMAEAEADRRSTHAMVGRDGRNRSLVIYLIAVFPPGVWEPVTGWRSALAHELLEREGRI
jgi:hypothetical protein